MTHSPHSARAGSPSHADVRAQTVAGHACGAGRPGLAAAGLVLAVAALCPLAAGCRVEALDAADMRTPEAAPATPQPTPARVPVIVGVVGEAGPAARAVAARLCALLAPTTSAAGQGAPPDGAPSAAVGQALLSLECRLGASGQQAAEVLLASAGRFGAAARTPWPATAGAVLTPTAAALLTDAGGIGLSPRGLPLRDPCAAAALARFRAQPAAPLDPNLPRTHRASDPVPGAPRTDGTGGDPDGDADAGIAELDADDPATAPASPGTALGTAPSPAELRAFGLLARLSDGSYHGASVRVTFAGAATAPLAVAIPGEHLWVGEAGAALRLAPRRPFEDRADADLRALAAGVDTPGARADGDAAWSLTADGPRALGAAAAVDAHWFTSAAAPPGTCRMLNVGDDR